MEQYIGKYIVYLTNNTFVEFVAETDDCASEIAELIADDENTAVDFIFISSTGYLEVL